MPSKVRLIAYSAISLACWQCISLSGMPPASYSFQVQALLLQMAATGDARGRAADEVVELNAAADAPQPQIVPRPAPAAAATQAIDLASLAAPLLLQRSPAAGTLYWKLVLAPSQGALVGSNSSQLELLQHLHCWLALQLQQGRPVRMPLSSAFVEGPVVVSTAGRSCAATTAEITICLASPDSDSGGCAAALAGASGVVVAVPSKTSDVFELQHQLQLCRTATPLPILLVAASDEAAQAWQRQIDHAELPPGAALHVVSVHETAAARCGSKSAGGMQCPERTAYSRQRLIQGLCWLAAHAPLQPILKVNLPSATLHACRRWCYRIACDEAVSSTSTCLQIVPLEVLARSALAATCMPLQRMPARLAWGPPAAYLVCTALQQAAALVEHVAL